MAVYTQLTDDDFRAFFEGRQLGDYIRHEGITQGVENTNYHVWTSFEEFVLTIVEKRTDPKDLPFIFSFMMHLNAAAIPVPRVLAQGELKDKPAALILFLEGACVDELETTPAHCAEVGALLAKMHKASEGFKMTRDNPMGPSQWQMLFNGFQDRIDPALRDEVASVLMQSCGDEWKTLPTGAVHVDLFRDNVFFKKSGKICGVIDFYFSCTAAYAYDLAITLNAWCFDPDNNLVPERVSAFLKAYEAIRPLSADERAAFPQLRRTAALRIFMTRMYDWIFTPEGATVVKKDPMEYLQKMRSDFSWL